MIRPSRTFYEFGPFSIDPEERHLLRDGQPVRLTPKAFETLLVLVENRGRIIEKEELMKRVWPDAFVEEGGLTRNISTLRKALDKNTSQQYIQTIPRRGYRFMARVKKRIQTSPYLKWLDSQGQEEMVSLTVDELVIGRKSDADIVLVNPYVSRHHAKFVKSDSGYRIIDLESSHGTYLNGIRIAEHELQSGDRIALGRDRVELVYYSEEGETAGKSDIKKK